MSSIRSSRLGRCVEPARRRGRQRPAEQFLRQPVHIQEERQPAAHDRRAENALILFRMFLQVDRQRFGVHDPRHQDRHRLIAELRQDQRHLRSRLCRGLLRRGDVDHLVEPQNPHRYAVHRDVFVLADALDPVAADHLDPTDLQERQCELLVRPVFKQQHAMRLCRLPRVCGLRRRLHRRVEAQPRVLDDSCHVGDQRDPAVSHDRRAGEDADPLDRGVHRLDDDFLRAAHLIHDQSKAAAGQPQDQDVLDAGRIGVSPRARPGSPPWSPP